MMPRTGYDRGFSLIEVMAATSILALGVVMIYQSFFITLDAFNYCRDYLAAAPMIDENMWHAQDTLKRLGSAAELNSGGKFMIRGREFKWELSYSLIGDLQDLYKIDMALYWHEGRKKAYLTRSAYEIYEKKK